MDELVKMLREKYGFSEGGARNFIMSITIRDALGGKPGASIEAMRKMGEAKVPEKSKPLIVAPRLESTQRDYPIAYPPSTEIPDFPGMRTIPVDRPGPSGVTDTFHVEHPLDRARGPWFQRIAAMRKK